MIPSLIFVVSVAALFQFFVSYCHSLLTDTRAVTLSEEVRKIVGLTQEREAAGEFERVLRLVSLCSGPQGPRNAFHRIGVYHSLLLVAARLSRTILPSVAAWIDEELRNCVYFAAVVLDRRISSNRNFLAEQIVGAF